MEFLILFFIGLWLLGGITHKFIRLLTQSEDNYHKKRKPRKKYQSTKYYYDGQWYKSRQDFLYRHG